METLLLLITDAFWSAVAATGFALLFNVPVRTLPVCALCGALGHSLRTGLMETGVTIEAGTLIGATAIGLLGEFLSHKVHTPASVFTIPGVIPMVPGTFAFRTMMGAIKLTYTDPSQSDAILNETVTYGIKTGIILTCLALGIAVMHLLFKKHLR
jgi:uncharacterized membrane protein YjjB (DUF3815 family)